MRRVIPQGDDWRWANQPGLLAYLSENRIDPSMTPLDGEIIEAGRRIMAEQFVRATGDADVGCGCGLEHDGMNVSLEFRVFPKRRGWFDPKPLPAGLIKRSRR